MSLTSKLSVVVLAGGDTAERDVSLQSGAAVMKALLANGHSVHLVDPSQRPVQQINWRGVDICFIALHGPYGEDGGVQQELEDLGVIYTGSGPEASAVAFHKARAKEIFSEHQLPTPAAVLLRADELVNFSLPDHLSLPLAVKPEAQGSSVGVSIVTEAAALPGACQLAFQFDEQILIEQAIPGTEWTVSLLDDCVLPPIEITTSRQFYDYSAKYEDEATCLRVAGQPELLNTLCEVSQRACRLLNTRGICRVDVRVDAQQRPWILEVNTIPGMTDHSLVPKAAAAYGWSFTELCERALEAALA